MDREFEEEIKGELSNLVESENIDDQVKMGGTIRTFKKETRSYIEKRLGELCKGIAEAHGAEIKIQFDLVNKYPPTINSKKESI